MNYPVEGLPPLRLVLTTTARVFTRHVSVGQEREPDRRRRRDPWFDTMASARGVHADQDKPAMPLTLSVAPIQGTALLIVVDEGDNTPLPITTARLLRPAYRMRLFHEGGSNLRVAYGRTGLARPQYDLALLAPQVLGTPATDASLEPEHAAAPSATTTATILSPRIFWAALAITVVALLGLIARLLQKESIS